MVVTLKQANADLPLIFTDYHLQIQPGGGVEKPAAAIGTGPYKLAAFEPGLRDAFEKNTDDWRQDRGYVDSVLITVMNDLIARINALRSGQVDLISIVEPKIVPLLKRGSGRRNPAHLWQGILLLPDALRHRAFRQ